MEKLLRDLNIYAHSFMNCNLTFTYDGNRIRVLGDEIGPYVAESIILNKKYGFIKWLVDNDKINTNIVYDIGFFARIYEEDEVGEYFEPYEEILMLLSIQDEPIEFLVSILK